MNRLGYGKLRIVLTFAVAFSLLTLPGTLSNSFRLPGVAPVWALPAPCPTTGSTGVCSDYWLPAGAAMDTFHSTVFESAVCEYDGLTGASCGCPDCSNGAPLLDIPDSKIPSGFSSSLFNSSSSYYLTAPSGQYAYLSGWQRVNNSPTQGIANFFTWLDAYSASPIVPGTIRQGFTQTTGTLDPYSANSYFDFYILNNIYDSLSAPNPLNPTQVLDWMTSTSSQTPLSNSQLTYAPPAGTVGTYRFTLRSDMFFQDGRKVTAFDVAFSYLSMIANGAPSAQMISGLTGVTVLSPGQFDINLNSTNFATKSSITNLVILPGHYWTGVGSQAWDSAIATCTATSAPCYPAQYTLGPTPPSGPPQAECTLVCKFSPSNLNADPSKTAASFDPIVNHDLVGTGAWTCGTVTIAGSGSCSSSGTMNPPIGGSYTLTRFGSGIAPGSSVSGDYFRSNGNLALWIWSGDNGDVTHDFLNFAMVAGCFGQPLQPLPNPCAHFQQGMGTSGTPIIVGLSQIAIVLRFFGVNWTSPFAWQTLTGIIPFPGPPPLVLYSGTVTLNPSSVIGCPGGYDC